MNFAANSSKKYLFPSNTEFSFICLAYETPEPYRAPEENNRGDRDGFRGGRGGRGGFRGGRGGGGGRGGNRGNYSGGNYNSSGNYGGGFSRGGGGGGQNQVRRNTPFTQV